MLNGQERDRFEKIARLMLAEVPSNQIAAVVGLDASRVSQIKNLPEFQEIYGQLAAEQVEQGREINQGWDAIEQDAMGIVITNLQHNKDPDYALKAAMVANKAMRRGGRGNVPIPTELGTRTVLNLTQTFVQNIQQNGIGHEKNGRSEGFSIPNDLRKYNDVQTPNMVEQLLKVVDEVEKVDKRSEEQKGIANEISELFQS